jgi:hypothetical protein
LERLGSLLDSASSPQAVLRALGQLPNPSPFAVDKLDAAISAGRLPVNDQGGFRAVTTRMTYLLDTNAVGDWMRAAPGIETWIAGLDGGDRVVTCTIVRGELLFGIGKLPEGKRRPKLYMKTTSG